MKILPEYIDSEGNRIRIVRHDRPRDFNAALAEMKYDGVDRRNVAPEFKNDPRYDLRYTQKHSDLNAVAFLLVTSGYHKADLHSRERPDVEATLADGAVVFIETAEVIASRSAQLDGVLNYVNTGIVKAYLDNALLRTKLDGHSIQARAWFPDSGAYNQTGILNDLLRFLRDVDFAGLERGKMLAFGDEYPALVSIEAKYSYCPTIAKIIPRLDPDAHSFAPKTLAAQVMPILQEKRRKAASYTGSPLWLALSMSDPLAVSKLSLDCLEGTPLDFSPYVKLLVGDQEGVLEYTRL